MSNSPKVERKLAAIMFTDIAGYTESMSYDEQHLHSLIKKADNIEFELNFRLYELIEDKSYLKNAYSQIQEKADAMEDKLKEKFLNYPIPKQIIEEYNKVFN